MSCKLCVAIDGNRELLVQAWREFSGLPVVLKFGVTLLPFLTVKDFEETKKRGFEIFVDAKLYDIPTQVAGAVASFCSLGADYITLHLSGGERMCAAAVERASNCRLLGVSVLTSFSQDEWTASNAVGQISDSVARLVQLGLRSGLRAFVCSVNELGFVPRMFEGTPVLRVTPGIQGSTGVKGSDQRRVVTVEDALAAGSGMLVMGRGILKAESPRGEADKVLEFIAAQARRDGT